MTFERQCVKDGCDRPVRWVGSGAFASLALCHEHWLEPFLEPA